MATTDLTVLLPALNEAESLSRLLPALKEVLARLAVSYEILVVDGGSTDGTPERARREGVRVLRQESPGFGGALKEGFAAADGNYVLAMDADGSHSPEVLPKLWALREGREVVIASRFVAGGSAVLSPFRYVLSWLLNRVSAWALAFPVKDSSSGFRLYRTAAVRGLKLRYKDFAAQQEILALILASGGRVGELPFRYEPRLGGRSKARVLPLAASYVRMLLELKISREGFKPLGALAAVLLTGLVTGLWGLGWGLPGPARLRAFPDGLRPTPQIAQKFADAWERLYEGIRRSHEEMRREEPATEVRGVEEIAPGWSFPPGKLINSYRSLLIQSENPDEKKSFIILSQMRPWKLEFEPLYMEYGGAFIYPLGGFLEMLSWAGAVRLTPDLRRYLLEPGEMGRIYLCGRLFILLFHLASLWVLYDMGRRLSGPGAGLLAALFFALCPVAVVNSHIVKPHPYAAFWCLAAARFCLMAVEGGAGRDYWLGGLCAGLAMGANFSYAGFALLPAMAWITRRLTHAARAGEGRRALGAAIAGVGVFLFFNPYVVLRAWKFYWEIALYPSPAAGWSRGLLTLLGPTAWAGLGPGLWLAAALGLLLPWRGAHRRFLSLVWTFEFLVLWLGLSRYWPFGGTGVGVLRLYYPLIGLACLLAGDFIARLPRSAAVAALCLILADAVPRSAVYLENMRSDCGPRSTSRQAASWIDEHVAGGSSVGLVRYPEPAHTPPFHYDRYRLVIFETPKLLPVARLPDYLVVDGEGLSTLEALVPAEYAVCASFLPRRALWARVRDDSFFANTGFFVCKRKGRGIAKS